MTSVLLLGSTPELSCAEIASQYPGCRATLVDSVLLLETEELPSLAKLTGSVKIGEVIFTCPATELKPERLVEWIVAHPRAAGKLTFAISFFGERWSQASRFPLECKRLLREQLDRPVRWFADADGYTSPAAVHKLGLVDEGYDVSVVIKDKQAHLAITREVQNPDLWTKIDMLRPRRNAKNGMLPPKLAEILVHLAGPNVHTLFDPFCGSGTLLEAAARADISTVYGADILPMIVDDAKQNLAWAQSEGLVPASTDLRLTTADATLPVDLPAHSIDAIVSKGYLGQPLQGDESISFLEEERREVELLWKRSLAHWPAILAEKSVVIAVWPEYKTQYAQTRVDLDDLTLRELGFKRVPFEIAGKPPQDDIMYSRPEQFIRRRIVKLQKI